MTVPTVNIFGSGYSLLSGGASLLDAGRRINRSGIGMSASSRAQLESFYNNGSALFNQLYARAESAEVQNVITIKALRAKHSLTIAANGGLSTDNADNGNAAASSNGTNVDTSA